MSQPRNRAATVFAEFGMLPYASAVGADGYLYAVDYVPGNYSRNRILKFAPDGELVAIWAGAATDVGIDEFTSVRSIAIDRMGGVYLSGLLGVRKLDPTGRPLADWHLQPTATRADAGLLRVGPADTLYVFTGTLGVRQFSRSGELLSSWPANRISAIDGYAASDMAVDGQGNIYLTDSAGDHVRKYSPTGELLAEWGRRGDGPGELNYPRGIDVDRWGNVYVADSGNDRVQQFSADGEFVAAWGNAGRGPGQFRRPSGLAIGARGDVYVVDSGNYRIQHIPTAVAP